MQRPTELCKTTVTSQVHPTCKVGVRRRGEALTTSCPSFPSRGLHICMAGLQQNSQG